MGSVSIILFLHVCRKTQTGVATEVNSGIMKCQVQIGSSPSYVLLDFPY